MKSTASPGSSLVQIIERHECRLPVGPGGELLIDTRIKGLVLCSAKQQDQGRSGRETYIIDEAAKAGGRAANARITITWEI